MPAVEPHPIRVVVRDDLERSRLTVFFRLLLLIPHIVWFFLWSLAALLAALVNWVATLVSGRPAGPLWEFLAAYLRYGTHVYSYGLLAANPFPGFTGAAGSYPIDLEIDPPQPQSRWKTGFRLLLAIPTLMLVTVLIGSPSVGGGGGWEGTDSETAYYTGGGAGVAFAVAFLGWFACLVRARMPNGFRDLLAYALRYSAQTWGYVFLLTDRYPDAHPADPPATPPPYRPVALTSEEDDLRRSRLTVFFRLLLALPHLVWLLLWSILVFFALVAGWLVALVIGRFPSPLHRFLAAFLRYTTHVYAFLSLVANPFPGFTGAAGGYPVDVRIDPPEPQRRLTILFRLLLAVPAFIVNSGLIFALVVAAFLGWFAALFTGRMPRGLRGLGAYALGYNAQTYGYAYLLTGRYPYSGPPGVDAGAAPEEAAQAWPEAPLPAPS